MPTKLGKIWTRPTKKWSGNHPPEDAHFRRAMSLINHPESNYSATEWYWYWSWEAGGRVMSWCLGRTSSVLVALPPALASLVVVSAFYSGSVGGAERAA
jgi:hypothetical protein